MINNNFLIDSHCHLDMNEFKDDLPQIIQNAKLMKVNFFQTICTRLSSLPNIIKIVEKYDNIFCSVGVHPCEIEKDDIVSEKKLIELSQHEKIISFGETGLDFYHSLSLKEQQIISFINHIKAARTTGLPIIVHARAADQEIIDVLQQQYAHGDFTGLIHCFSSSRELAYAAIELGMYISVAGIVTFKNATALQDVIKEIPLSSLILETDAPYLAPVPMRGKRCEPAYTRHTAEFIASLKNITLEEVMSTTTQNFKNLFKKANFN